MSAVSHFSYISLFMNFLIKTNEAFLIWLDIWNAILVDFTVKSRVLSGLFDQCKICSLTQPSVKMYFGNNACFDSVY